LKQIGKTTNLQEYILSKYRGEITTVFLLPVSVVLKWFLAIKNLIIVLFNSTPKKHQQRIENIQNQLEKWRKEGMSQKLCTNRSPWKSMSELVPRYKQRYNRIDVDMHSILEIDVKRQVVKVEPMVNMGQITAALNPKGWTLAIVPELDDLTVGGLIMGFGVESSSHQHGLFQYICKSFDIVTPDGESRHCSEDENQDLFYSIPWSHGTLGFLVAAELKIIPAKKFVELTYQPTYTREELLEKFENASRQKSEFLFVEALTFSRDEAVLMVGKLADKPINIKNINRIGRWHKPWFYSHVQTYLKKGRGTEYIPLRHYYHRHTRSYFWEMKDIIPFGNKNWFRWLLGWTMPPHIQLLKRLQTETIQQLREKRHVVQDMIIPINYLAKSLDYFDKNYDMHPLWLCPLNIYENKFGKGFVKPFSSKNGTDDELFVDIGAYGTPTIPGFDGNSTLKKLEQFVIDHSGYQALYARTLMSEDQFRQMFDHELYDKLREQIPFVKKAFDDVYTKVAKGRLSPHDLKRNQADHEVDEEIEEELTYSN